MVEPTGDTLVFVYGTLLSGEPHHELIARGKYRGTANTVPDFQLVDLGGFPAMITPGECSISGELYSVDGALLESIDEFEDHPSFFRRTSLRLQDGRSAQGWLLRPSLAIGNPSIPSGDWRTRPAEARR